MSRHSRQGASTVQIAVTIGAFALAGFLLWISLKGIEWARVGTVLRSAELKWLIGYIALASTAQFLRAFRWRILLLSAGKVSIPQAFWATAAGYFGNNFLPARAGEVVRTMMISARTGLSKAFVLTTALTERMADGIALVTVSSLVLLTLPERPGWLQSAAKPFAIAGGIGVVAIAVMPWLEAPIHRLLEKLPIPQGLAGKIGQIISHIVHGIKSYHDPKRISGFLGLTVVIWCLDAVSALLVAHSVNLGMTMLTTFLLIAGLGLGSAIPSTPGYVGIYQFVAVSILTPFGIAKTDAVAYIILWQALQYVVVTFWGVLAVIQNGGFRKAAQAQ